ncbi:hypothetical protein Tco_0457766 [Tanacetum coccineum]
MLVMTSNYGVIVEVMEKRHAFWSLIEEILRYCSDNSYAEMDNLDITMEEYIELEAEKAHRCDFPAIVYKDALTSELGVSSEPMVSAHHVKKVDFDFVISFDESDDEYYTFTYDKNSFSYKLVYVNDLKSDSDNDNDEINIKQSSRDISV